MLHAILQLFLYALLASLSALSLAAGIAAMQTGRLKAVALGAGFVAGQLFTCSLFVLIGVAAISSRNDKHPGIQASLEILVAVGLSALALRIRATGAVVKEGSNPRVRLALERLGRLRFLTMLLAGLLLGIGGPKRLLLTAFAATAITTAGVGEAAETALVIWYVAIATVLVWAPILLFVFIGERVVALMTNAQKRVARHQPEVTVYGLLLLAALLVIDAITVL
jgi:hypothetical protein